MKRPALGFLAVAGLVGLCATVARAENLQLTIKDGRVTLIADNVPVRSILEEWARVGDSRIVNADKLVGPPVSLRLVEVPERQALEVVLRSAAGYLAAPRLAGSPGASQFDRILILATSRPPAATASRSVSTPPPLPVAPQPGTPEDLYQPEEWPDPNAQPAPMAQPFPGPFPGANPQPENQQPQILTAPRPGFLPVPPPGPTTPVPVPPTLPTPPPPIIR